MFYTTVTAPNNGWPKKTHVKWISRNGNWIEYILWDLWACKTAAYIERNAYITTIETGRISIGIHFNRCFTLKSREKQHPTSKHIALELKLIELDKRLLFYERLVCVYYTRYKTESMFFVVSISHHFLKPSFVLYIFHFYSGQSITI